MPLVEINDLGTVGVIVDTPPYVVPPEAFTTGLNVRVIDNGIERMLGWDPVFGAPGVPPRFLMPISDEANTFWLYAGVGGASGAGEIWVWNGITHTDLTGAVYAAAPTPDWNGTLSSGFAIINNGSDPPQYWHQSLDIGLNMAPLPAWPAGMRAKVVRAFGPYLVAINIDKTTPAGSHPHMVKWSHGADPGTLPNSWNEADPTKDAGEWELPDVGAGILMDALPLSETMYLYKESSVWKMRYIGGRFIFDFGKSAWLPTTGILGPRCVCLTGDGTRQVWASQDDILWHDGNRVRSILTEKRRRQLFNSIDTVSYRNSFIFTNPFYGEIWFCYPSQGFEQPNRAIVMNYMRGGDQWPVTDADGITFQHASVGPIAQASNEIWDFPSDGGGVIWDFDDGPWEQIARRRVILASMTNNKFYNLDFTTERDGVGYIATLQRVALSVMGKKRNGDWIVDFDQVKMFDQLWLKLANVSGNGFVQLRFGVQQTVNGPVEWKPAIGYNPSRVAFTYCGPTSGRAGAIEIISDNHFRLDGYAIEVLPLGMF